MDAASLQIISDRLITLGIATLAAALAGVATLLFFYAAVLYSRLKKREQMSLEMVTLEVRVSKDNEIKIDAAEQLFASFSSLKKGGFFSFLDVDDVICFEIVGRESEIRFYICPCKNN